MKLTGRVGKRHFRALILMLYATGAVVGEVLNLKQKDIDLKAGMVTMTGGGANRSRQIPIGPDMQNVLRKYLAWRSKKNLTNAQLFVTKNDLPLSVSIVVKNWRKLRTFAGIIRR